MLAPSRYLLITSEIITPVIIIVLVIVTYYLVLFSPLFQIKHVACTANYEPCQNENIIKEIEKNQGQNLFLFNADNLIAKLTKGDYFVRKVSVSKSLPGTISVNIEFENPSFAFAIIGNNQTWVVCDQEGRVLAIKDQDPNLVTIYTDSLPKIYLGEVIAGDVYREASDLALLIAASDIKYQDISIVDNSTLALRLESGKIALFSTSKNHSEQLASLQAIIADDTIKQEYTIIDLRFSQAILRQN